MGSWEVVWHATRDTDHTHWQSSQSTEIIQKECKGNVMINDDDCLLSVTSQLNIKFTLEVHRMPWSGVSLGNYLLKLMSFWLIAVFSNKNNVQCLIRNNWQLNWRKYWKMVHNSPEIFCVCSMLFYFSSPLFWFSGR